MKIFHDEHYLCAEASMSDVPVQPYTHDVFLTLHVGQHVYHCYVFFRRHKRLLRNTFAGNSLGGDTLVVSADALGRFMPTLPRHYVMADAAVKR